MFNLANVDLASLSLMKLESSCGTLMDITEKSTRLIPYFWKYLLISVLQYSEISIRYALISRIDIKD